MENKLKQLKKQLLEQKATNKKYDSKTLKEYKELKASFLIKKLEESTGKKVILEEVEEIKFTIVLLGGNIGGKPITSISSLKGKENIDNKNVFENISDAKEKAKRLNKILSPGEKSFYNMKYVVAKLKDEKYI